MAMALSPSTSKSTSSQRAKEHTQSSRDRESKELRLHHLIDITFEKIETIRGYLVKEAAILGMEVQDAEISAVLQRQNLLMNRAISCFNNGPQNTPNSGFQNRDDRRASGGRKPSVSFKIDNEEISPIGNNVSNSRIVNVERQYLYDDGNFGNDKPCFVRTEDVDSVHFNKEDYKVDSSWFGSLDRNYGKKKKEAMDKRRRHTKTIGSMAGLDFIKKSHELQPDEQYEIGLPNVSSGSTSKLSRSIHSSQSYPALPPSWTRPADLVDSPNQMKSSKHEQIKNSTPHQHHRQQSGIAEFDMFNFPSCGGKNAAMAKELVKARLGTGPNHIPTSQSYSIPGSSKRWFETNLDDSNSMSQLSPALPCSIAGKDSSSGSGVSLTEALNESLGGLQISEPISDAHEINSNESGESWSASGFTNESTKPFEMSDYYKYSTKFRTPTPRHRNREGEATSFTPISALSPNMQIPLTEQRKINLIDYFTQKAIEDAALRNPNNPNPDNRIVGRIPVDSFSGIMKTPLTEEKKHNLIEYHTQKAAQDEAYRHPKPASHTVDFSKTSKFAPSPAMQTSLTEERKNDLIEYFTRKTAEDNAARLINNNSPCPELPPKYASGRKLMKRNDASDPVDTVEELLAWMPDTPTFV